MTRRLQRFLDLVANLRQTGRSGLRDYLEFRRIAKQRQPVVQRELRVAESSFSDDELRELRSKRLLFILPVAERGGGANVVLSEARCLRDLGVDVWLGNLRGNRGRFAAIASAEALRVAYFRKYSNVVALAGEFDAVVATAWSSTEALFCLGRTKQFPILGYYIQDYEPYFYAVGSAEREFARRSYHLPERAKLFTKTHWNKKEVLRNEGIEPVVVGPSVDTSMFNMHGREDRRETVRVCAMVRPATPRRAPELTMRVLRQLQQRFASAVRITIFGCSHDDLAHANLERDFTFENLGILESVGVAQLLKRSDLFLDLSAFQAMGLTALEAMACGVVVVGPKHGGLPEIIQHGVFGLLVDTQNEAECIAAAASLAENCALIDTLRRGIPDMEQYSPAKASSRIARLLLLEH